MTEQAPSPIPNTSAADRLIDRMHLKSQISKWRIAAVVAVVLALIVLVESRVGGIGGSAIQSEYIARITIEDMIFDDRDRIEIIDEVLENDKAKALIVVIDSPGGTVVGGEELFYHIKAVAKEKPVVAVMRSLATSAGYMAAIGADHIVAREGTVTGSIGVLMQSAEFTEMAKMLGINPILIKSSPLKGTPGMFEKPTEKVIAELRVIIDEMHNMFINMVADARGFTHEQATALADGRVFTGRQALKLKLIDALGGEAEAIEWLETEKKIPADLNIKDVDKKNKNLELLEEFAESSMRKIFGNAASGLDGAVSIWQPSLQLQ